MVNGKEDRLERKIDMKTRGEIGRSIRARYEPNPHPQPLPSRYLLCFVRLKLHPDSAFNCQDFGDLLSTILHLFSRVHATLQPALSIRPSVGWSVGRSVCRSVGPSHFYFFYQFYFFKSFKVIF